MKMLEQLNQLTCLLVLTILMTLYKGPWGPVWSLKARAASPQPQTGCGED